MVYGHFPHAVEIVLRHEGGYVNDPADPGGETRWGISKRTYPDLDIAALTRDDAMAIYGRDWWSKYSYGMLNDRDVATKLLDISVNVGPRQAHIMFQRALHAAGQTHVDIDGIIGPQTLDAANEADPDMVVAALRAEAAAYYRALIAQKPALSKYERGWMKRAYS